MQELIRVTETPEGERVVSAKELYEFLGMDKSQWARWSKKNIEENDFAIENQDWQGFDLMSSSKNGAMTKDYALSLDFSKRLSMMARTEKGEQLRNYFIECEKALKENVKPKTQAELFLESAKMLVEQEQRLSQVETKLAQIEESRNVATQELLLAERSTESIPEETTRAKIRRIINQYCNAKNADQRSVWNVVYDRLYYRYGVNLRAIVKNKNESTLKVAERLGHLDKIYAICSYEFH